MIREVGEVDGGGHGISIHMRHIDVVDETSRCVRLCVMDEGMHRYAVICMVGVTMGSGDGDRYREGWMYACANHSLLRNAG